jgi:hypothetical protein
MEKNVISSEEKKTPHRGNLSRIAVLFITSPGLFVSYPSAAT